MARKVIPSHLREFLESQIVRGSRGYEPMERILKSVSEEDLKSFLEYYEESIRDALVDFTGDEKESPEDIFAAQARKLQEADLEKESSDVTLGNLFRDLANKK